MRLFRKVESSNNINPIHESGMGNDTKRASLEKEKTKKPCMGSGCPVQAVEIGVAEFNV